MTARSATLWGTPLITSISDWLSGHRSAKRSFLTRTSAPNGQVQKASFISRCLHSPDTRSVSAIAPLSGPFLKGKPQNGPHTIGK